MGLVNSVMVGDVSVQWGGMFSVGTLFSSIACIGGLWTQHGLVRMLVLIIGEVRLGGCWCLCAGCYGGHDGFRCCCC